MDASQETSIWLQLSAVAVSPVGTVGATVSAHAGVLLSAVALMLEPLPALSTAATWYEYTVDAARPVSAVDVAGARTSRRKTPLR